MAATSPAEILRRFRAGGIGAAGVHRPRMLRGRPAGTHGLRRVEPGFSLADVVFDAMDPGRPAGSAA